MRLGRRLAAAAVLAAAAGCGGAAPEELRKMWKDDIRASEDLMRKDVQTQVKDAVAGAESRVGSDVQKKILDVMTQVTVLRNAQGDIEKLRAQVQSLLDELTKKNAEIDGKMKGVTDRYEAIRQDLLKLLQAEQELLQEREKTLQLLLDDLKKG